MSLVWINQKALKRDTCKLLLSRFFAAKMTEAQIGLGENREVAVAVNEDENFRLKYVDTLGRTCYNLAPDNPDFDYVIDKIEPFLPKSEKFARVTFCQFIHYPEGTFMPYHKDSADKNDTGTALVFLNEDFRGGRLSVNGVDVNPSLGDVIAFEDSTEVWHGVEPIYKGDRIVVAIWFGYPEDEPEDC